MPKRISRGGIPLEKQTASVALTTISTIETDAAVLDFDLLPDEIAEIHIIDSDIWIEDPDEVERTVNAALYLTMDPNVSSSSPSARTLANLEDLEVFYSQRYTFHHDLTTSGEAETLRVQNKQMKFPEKYPYLVGTNVGLVFSAVSDIEVADANCLVTVYFKRRRATAMELNQILLKRR